MSSIIPAQYGVRRTCRRFHSRNQEATFPQVSFYIRTNSGGRTFRLVSADVNNPHREACAKSFPIARKSCSPPPQAFSSHLVLHEREGGLPYLRIVPLGSATQVAPSDPLASSHRIAFSEPVYKRLPRRQSRIRHRPPFASNTNPSSPRARSSITT